MSFIGPRPELLRYTDAYEGMDNNILNVRPGITDYSSINFINLDEIVGSNNADEMYEKYVCFAMICHHCGQRYIEFFPNARQENLFIGMLHAFQYMGMSRDILTDNMKSVVLRRDLEGKLQIVTVTGRQGRNFGPVRAICLLPAWDENLLH